MTTKKQQEQVDPRKMVAKIAQAMGVDIDPDEYAAEVLRTGDKIILPDGASIPDVIKALQAEYDAERQKVSVNTTLPVAPWDGAIALHRALTEELGLTQALEIPATWFTPEQPPQQIEVEYELGKTMTVRWGRFSLPGMEGAIAETGVARDANTGEFNFTCKITTVRRWEKRAKKILDRTREFAAKDSIHKGKAFSIRFFDPDGDQIAIPTPVFFPFTKAAPVFRRDLEDAIERNIFTPLRYSKELLEMGESLKRGVLFAGKYGTGKTMLASAIAQVAVQNGWTFVYVKESAELPMALRYATKFQPAVVFCEDVDRIAGSARTDEVNNLLNQLDGIDSKATQLMTVLTSNHSNRVNKAMRRPGRIDMVLQVLPPDAEAIGRMVKAFVADGLEANADLTGIGKVLDGYAPAYIREACARAKLEALRRTGNPNTLINGDDLELVAKEVARETTLFTADEDEANKHVADDLDALGDGFSHAGAVMKKVVARVRSSVEVPAAQVQ